MTTWWKRTSRYLSSYSKFFIVTGGIAGGAYLLAQYAISRFQQIQEKLMQDKNAKENLRRRFAQNQEDCTFTVLALLPTLGNQLFDKFNVEQLTESLRTPSPAQSTSPTQPALAASADHSEPTSVSSVPEPSTSKPEQGISRADAESNHNHQEATSGLSPPALPSIQLNPLAKSFVPSANPSKTQQGEGEEHPTQVPTNVVECDSSPQPPFSAVPIDGPSAENLRNAAVSPASVTAISHSEDHAGPSTSMENQQSAANEPASHLDVQAQRAKILADKQAKLLLWNRLKITSFSRVVTSLYCIVLLTVQTHIQLNLIGRFAYLASVEAQAYQSENQQGLFSSSDSSQDQERAHSDTFGLDHETERLYLTFSWWFLHQGWISLSDRVSNAIEKVLSPLSVKAQLSMADLRTLLGDARKMIEQDSHPGWIGKSSHFLDILFPVGLVDEVNVLVGAGAASKQEAESCLRSNTKLRALLDETKDIIESEDFNSVLGLCFDRVFAVFFNTLNPSFGIQTTGNLDSTVALDGLSARQSRFQEITDDMEHGRRIRLASLFPLVSRQSHLAIHGVPNEYVEDLAQIKELRALSAIIYAAWSQV